MEMGPRHGSGAERSAAVDSGNAMPMALLWGVFKHYLQILHIVEWGSREFNGVTCASEQAVATGALRTTAEYAAALFDQLPRLLVVAQNLRQGLASLGIERTEVFAGSGKLEIDTCTMRTLHGNP